MTPPSRRRVKSARAPKPSSEFCSVCGAPGAALLSWSVQHNEEPMKSMPAARLSPTHLDEALKQLGNEIRGSA